MVIKSITTEGSTNTLRYAVDRKIPIFNNQPLLRFIEPETYFAVTYSDMTMLEVFLMASNYRNKMWIVKEEPPAMPTDEELSSLFSGYIDVDNEHIPDSKFVHDAIDQFISIFKQMLADFDIIQDKMAIEFVPMIARRFEVRIPISFSDITSGFTAADEMDAFIDAALKGTLIDFMNTKIGLTIQNILRIIIVRNTSVPRYDVRYEKFLEAFKYAPLRKVTTDKPYRVKLSAVNRFDDTKHINHSSVLFNTNKDEINTKMATMSQCTTPIIADFVVELPVQNMMNLMNSFSSEELPIMYLSSMKQMIDSIAYIIDFVHKGIKIPNLDLSNHDDPAIQERLNRLDAYQIRIEMAIDNLLGLIQKLLTQEPNCDITSVFSLLPSIIMSKAVISVSNFKIAKFLYQQDDPVNIEMFNDVESILSSLKAQMER